MANVLIFSPHPDDVELFVGGTLLKHLHDHDTVEIILMSNGEKGTILKSMQGEKIKKLREEETVQRMKLIPEVKFTKLNLPDAEIAASSENIQKVVEILQLTKPDIIYLPEIKDAQTYRNHPDHKATAEIVSNAVYHYNQSTCLRFYHTHAYNLFIDITPYYTENQNALRCYKSQYRWSADSPFLLYRLEFTRYLRTRWWGLKNKCRFAESYREQHKGSR